MEEIRTGHSWQHILGSVCTSLQKKQEIAQAVGFVSVRTIDRWISGQSNPQKVEMIRKLSQAIPETAMLEALQHEFPDAFQLPRQSAIPALSIERINLPVEFYRRVLHAYSHVPLPSRRWTIFNLLSNQILPQLDTERMGLMMIYVRCIAKVITFEEGAGTMYWTTRQVQEMTCTDSWLVQAVIASHPLFIQSCTASCVSPSLCLVKQNLIQSMGFFPLYRSGNVAGGLLLCSTQEDFFTPVRQTLIEEYSCLFSLALSDNDFFPVTP
ncbi:MAG: hypothetical protein ACRDHZ_20660 [Ktedonobacteraceae bacterium]